MGVNPLGIMLERRTLGWLTGRAGAAGESQVRPGPLCSTQAFGALSQSGHRTRVCFYKRTSSADTYEFEDLAESEPIPIDSAMFRDDKNEIRSLFGLPAV